MSELCGAWGGCVLPAGHNMGRVDIPENHEVPVDSPREKAIDAGATALGRIILLRPSLHGLAAAVYDAMLPIIRDEWPYEYELIHDGDPKMDGGHERRCTGRFTNVIAAQRGFELLKSRRHSEDNYPNLRIERRQVGPWEVVR
jgi:hypothetical protein